MSLKRICGFCLVVFFSVFTSGCFTIEKEIFLNADGSGELLLHVSMPDLPEKAKGELATSPQNPFSEFEKFRKEIMTKLPPTVKLKEGKQVKQNGVLNFFAIIEFKDLKDTEKIFADLSEMSGGNAPVTNDTAQGEWTSSLVKQGDKSTYTERFYFDIGTSSEVKTSAEVKTSPPPPKRGTRAKGGAARSSPNKSQASATADVKVEGMEQLEALMLSLVRLRFVLHAPAPISSSNADIVLNNRIAVWNCSLINFSKEKKPIELKATY